MYLALVYYKENIRCAIWLLPLLPCTEHLAYFAVKLMQLQEAGQPGCLELVHGACIFN